MREHRCWGFGQRLVVVVGVMVSVLAGGEAQSLTWLGTLGGSASVAHGVSADGRVVVGWAYNASGRQRAFRWENGVMQDLGTLPGSTSSEAWDVSDDGRVVVGYSPYPIPEGIYYRAFRWVAGQGMQDLGTLPGGWSSRAHGVSGNGGVVVGESDGRAFRWENGVMQDLGTLGGSWSGAMGVSASGRVVVGWSYNADGQPRAFRWENGVMQDLGTLPGGNGSAAWGVSPEGRVVVGVALDASNQTRAFRWENGVMQNLGTLPGTSDSWALGASGIGRVVVGWATNASNQARAFRWIENQGMQDLNQVFAALLTDGSILFAAFDISPDGRYIVGYGYNALTNRLEGFLLDTVPEPASLLALSTGLLGLLRRRKR